MTDHRDAELTERLLTEADRQRGQGTCTGSDPGSRVMLWVLAAAVVGWSVLIVGVVWYVIRWWT